VRPLRSHHQADHGRKARLRSCERKHALTQLSVNGGIDTRAIQDWLGHVSITHTTRYTALSPARFKDFWRD